MDRASHRPKSLEWAGSSKKDLKALPDEVMDVFGYALCLAQTGGRHPQAKPLHGIGSSVFEVVADWRGNTYRAVYTVRFVERVFDLIRQRLQVAAGRAEELKDEQAQGK